MEKIIRFMRKQMERLIKLITNLFHPKSIKRMFALSFSLLAALFIFLFLVSTLYFSAIMRNQVYDSMKETMQLYNDQISQDFTEALTYLSENCIQNADISSLNIAQTPNEIYLHTTRINKTLSVGNYSFSNIGGLFVYSQPQDIFIRQINDSWDNSQNNLKCAQLVKDMLQDSNQKGVLDQLNLSKWFLLSDEDDYFLVRIIKNRNTYAGAWANLQRISAAFKYFEAMDALMVYVDNDGICVGNPDFEKILLDSQGSLDKPSYFRSGLFQKYLTVSNKLDYCDYYIMALIPTAYILKELAPLYGLMIFILIWLLLFGLTIISVMNHFLNAPSRILMPVIASLRSGQFEAKIETDYEFQEIQNITGTFNDMISEIQELRIHIYEEQLAKKELELQYLKTQIAPHFLINCLNTIFFLSQDKANLEITHRIVQALSEHLRYTLAARTNVSLEEEINYVKNYLILTQLRFPNTLNYDICVEEPAMDAQVFPLLLLMLTENSIKANLVMGENFSILIKGYHYNKDGKERIHLTHIDSGSGFDSDSLQLYNHIIEHPEARKNGYSIGIYNTVMRLSLTMGDSAEIWFSNETDQGARIDIDFPYIQYRPEEESDTSGAETEKTKPE